jgi:phospholipase C
MIVLLPRFSARIPERARLRRAFRLLRKLSVAMALAAAAAQAQNVDGYSLTVSPATVPAGGAVTVTWKAPAGSPAKDWIVAYQDADSGKAYKTWIYTQGAASGTWHTTAWGAAGHTFRFRYLHDDGYTLMATSNTGTATAIVPQCLEAGKTASAIKHVVVIVQENKSFDSYFGAYCQAEPGSNPACTTGPACCEKAPLTVQGSARTKLTDTENAGFDPNHSEACILAEMNGGLMDRFVSGASCGSNPRNFAVADQATLGTYWDFAARYALADRYFHSAAGASSMNDMFLARAAYVFTDNSSAPDAVGKECVSPSAIKMYSEPTIGDLLADCKVDWAWYMEGYAIKQADKDPAHCYPQYYDPSDNPMQYYPRFTDKPAYNRDYAAFAADIQAGTLPAVSFVKAQGIRSEHGGSPITPGSAFVKNLVDVVLGAAAYKENTLILLTYDESGGYYDHVRPPGISQVDGKAYGPRLPLMAIGRFARANAVSHVQLEHASIVRFIEWNWLAGAPGQLRTRDAIANNLGSLLDSAQTGVQVPSDAGSTGFAAGKPSPAGKGPQRPGLKPMGKWLGRRVKAPGTP